MHQRIRSVSAAVFFVAAMGIGSLAQADAPAPRTLKNVMSEMGENAKTIFNQMKDPALNADTATKVEKFRVLILEATAFVPEWVKRFDDPNAVKIEYLEYNKYLANLYVSGTNLQQSFINNKNDEAQKIFKELLDIKKQGHTRFIEPRP